MIKALTIAALFSAAALVGAAEPADRETHTRADDVPAVRALLAQGFTEAGPGLVYRRLPGDVELIGVGTAPFDAIDAHLADEMARLRALRSVNPAAADALDALDALRLSVRAMRDEAAQDPSSDDPWAGWPRAAAGVPCTDQILPMAMAGPTFVNGGGIFGMGQSRYVSTCGHIADASARAYTRGMLADGTLQFTTDWCPNAIGSDVQCDAYSHLAAENFCYSAGIATIRGVDPVFSTLT
ncbi:MAG: hypothetical protein AAF772_13200, partial [Acidobacteriota bacterium]